MKTAPLDLPPVTKQAIPGGPNSRSTPWLGQLGTRHDDDEAFRRGERMGRVGFDYFFPWMAGHPCLTLRVRSLSLQGDPANIGKGLSRPARCTRGAGDRFGIPNPRKSGSVIGADRQRFGPSCVLLKRMPQGPTESGGIVLAANAGPRVPSGGVTLKRRCTYRP